MSSLITQQDALKAALNMAAAKLEAMDLAQVFGDEIVDRAGQDPRLDAALDAAQKHAVARIRSLVKP